ncbi:MAG TPA: hypothetical protein GXX19_03630 [Syntrophomonadaceae bacterium]|nr:hypothetical protein [Syntrophomonadaceae bacterium]
MGARGHPGVGFTAGHGHHAPQSKKIAEGTAELAPGEPQQEFHCTRGAVGRELDENGDKDFFVNEEGITSCLKGSPGEGHQICGITKKKINVVGMRYVGDRANSVIFMSEMEGKSINVLKNISCGNNSMQDGGGLDGTPHGGFPDRVNSGHGFHLEQPAGTDEFRMPALSQFRKHP